MTLAGILMFGTWEAIQDVAPNYFVDYQERPEARTEEGGLMSLCRTEHGQAMFLTSTDERTES
jgi:hypothetical protein